MVVESVLDRARPTQAESVTQRHARRLTDKLFSAFHQACDQREYDMGATLLQMAEIVLTRDVGNFKRSRGLEQLVTAHERLWTLRHEGGAGASP